MKSMIYIAGLITVAIATPSSAKELTTFEQQISYSVGYKVGKSLKAGEGHLNLDLDVLEQAITDVMTGAPLKLTEDQMKAAFTKLQAERQAHAQLGR
jgi:FKBP-type peptidyl-prolyl cis-trans isomerase